MGQPPRLNLPQFGADDPFRRLKRLVIERTGHFYYEDKDDLLWERVQRRLKARRVDVPAYILALADDEAEWAALEAEITVGETFFFRYAEQFQALRDTILPDILERNAQTRRIRIWSAGCATGAEPYSIAILLHEMLGEALAGWRVSILGTDINDAFLAQARQGRFGRWALRSLSAADRERWFVESGPAAWSLRTAYRAMVRFERGNLLDLLGSTPPLEWTDFDLILCRNVLIYFHPDMVNRIVEAMGARLSDDGWLLVGHAEPNPAFGEMLAAVQLPGTVAYRPPGSEVPPPPPPAPSFDPPAPAPEHRPSARLPTARRMAKAAPVPAPAPPPIEKIVEQVRARADAGDLDGAALKCAEGLALARESAVLHFYDGIIRQSRDQLKEAEAAFRRALYLDGEFVMAHYHLGLLLRAVGRAADGRRSITVAAKISGTMSPDARLREGAGLTAGGLRDLARLHLGAAEGA